MQTFRRSSLLSLVLLAAALGVAAPAAAQGGRLKIPPTPQPAKPVDPPVPAEAPAPQDPAKSASPAASLWNPPANAAEAIFADFETSKDLSGPARARCLDRLRGLGLETRATALKALTSDYGPSVLLAAELLEWVGLTASEDPSDVSALVEAASRTGMVEASGRCLDAAIRLNGGALPTRSVTLLSHPNRSVRTVAEGRLRGAPSPVHLERLLETAEHGRDADVRLRGTRLLGLYASAPETRPVLRRLLRDESVEVAFTAAASLAGEARPEQVLFLVSELRQRVSGAEAGYLAYALLLQQSSNDAALVSEDALPRLEALLKDSDLFASGAAAACLAEYAYRSGASVPKTWSAEVGFALVRAVGGVVFYPQYARFSPMAVETLKRATGEDFPDRGAWLSWYEALGSSGIRFLRARIALPEEQLPRLRVSWQCNTGEAAPAWRTLAGSEAWLLPSERLIGPRVLAELAEALRGSGFLEPIGGANRYGQSEEPVQVTLEIVLGEQRKRLAFRGSAAEGEIAKLAARLDAWHDEHAWQVLAGADGREFILGHLEAMEGFDPAARAVAMVDLTRGRVAALDPTLLAQWCQRLAAAPGVPAVLDAAVATEMLGNVAARAGDPALAAQLADTALLRPDPALAPFLADAAAAVDEPLRSRLLLAGLPRLGLDAARVVLQDTRLPVRIAAVTALRGFGTPAAEVLRALLQEAEQPVRVAAVRALGEIADSGAFEQLATLAGPGDELDLRKEAVWALGRLGDPRGVPVLLAAAESDQPALRVTALLALSATPGPAADQALGGLFAAFAGTALEGSYLRALMERGAASARSTLQPYLVHPQPALARRAAMLDGLLGDPAAATNLMAWLPNDPRNPELLEALANTLCVDFRDLPDPAGTYLAWWRDHADKPAWSWFQEAAAGSGFTLAVGFAQVGAASERESVKTLLAILASGPAHLRASATYFLHGLTGVDAQVVLAGTPRPEVERRIQPWRAWLDG